MSRASRPARSSGSEPRCGRRVPGSAAVQPLLGMRRRQPGRAPAEEPVVAGATFRPHPEHAAGPRHVLNGGIIATVLDCHGVCTAVADGYRRAGRRIGDGEPIWFATGTLTVTYAKPAPVDADLELNA